MSLVMDDGWDGDSEGVYIDVLLAILLTILPAVLSLGPMDCVRIRKYEWPANRAQT